MDPLHLLQEIFGWIYFFSWSATFWPQVALLFKRRNTGGFSPDFMAINVVGFISYSIFTFTSYYNSDVSASYKKSVGTAPQVEYTDVLFAAHGAAMCFTLILQMFIYPPRTPPHPIIASICALFFIGVIGGLIGAVAGVFDWYKYLQFSGMTKVLSSLVKHVPQVLLNRARKSTVGWSYTMILLDVVGGSFSLAQQVIRCVRFNTAAPFTSNLPKTFLAVESLAFDFYFIAQHVLWYTDREDIDVSPGSGSGGASSENAKLMHEVEA